MREQVGAEMTTTTSCASAHRDSNTAEHFDHRADCHLNTATGRPLSPNSSKLRFAISLAVYPNRTIGSVGRSTVMHGRREGLVPECERHASNHHKVSEVVGIFTKSVEENRKYSCLLLKF
jgi:hypothetical protein